MKIDKIDNERIANQERADQIREALIERHGENYLGYRELWDASREMKLVTDFPLHLDLDTIDGCNLHCKFCPEEHGFIRKLSHQKMSPELVSAVFDEVDQPSGRDRLRAVNIGNTSEPLLNKPVLFQILERCRQAGVIETFIHTNGLLLTLLDFKQLAQAGLTYLFVSIDAIREETYREARGGDLRRVMDQLTEIVEWKNREKLLFPVVRVSFIETDLNRDEKMEFINYWIDKADFIDIQTLLDYTKTLAADLPIESYCIQPFHRMGVGVSGELGLCCTSYFWLPENRIGTVPTDTIHDVWNGEYAAKLRQAMTNQDLTGFDFCYECLGRRL